MQLYNNNTLDLLVLKELLSAVGGIDVVEARRRHLSYCYLASSLCRAPTPRALVRGMLWAALLLLPAGQALRRSRFHVSPG